MPLKNFFLRGGIKVLEITIENCNKCDIETIIDPNNSQHCWINRRFYKLKPNVTGKLFSISATTHQHKNMEKN